MSRKETRDELFRLVFEADINEELPINVLEKYKKYDKVETDDIEFLEKYLIGLSDNFAAINSLIEKNLMNWKLDRIGIVERALLRVAIYEMEYENIGEEIAINEAVELAKKYGEEKSFEFINGVLGKYLRNR